MATLRLTARRLSALLPPEQPGASRAAGGAIPRYLDLAERIRMLVGDGRLLSGTVLPSERELGTTLGLSRTTVTRAYDVLRDRGIVVSRRGSGTVVQAAAAPLPDGLNAAVIDGAGGGVGPTGRAGPVVAGSGVLRGAAGITVLGAAGARPQPDLFDMTCAAPAGHPDLLPWFEAALAHLPAYVTDAGYHSLGLPVLREALARRFTERGLPTGADQILVTTGALAALAVIARAYVGPGDRVLLENPTYPGAIAAMMHAGARLVGIPVGGDVVAAAGPVVAGLRPRMAVLIPDFQNPTGRLMPEQERVDLAALLDSHGARVVIDETMLETGLDDAPMPMPFALASRSALTIGSSSKSHWGGLRLGWIRAPREELPTLMHARLTMDIGASVLEQLVLTAMLGDGVHSIAGTREIHARQRDALVEAVRERLPDWEFTTPRGGLSLWCKLPREMGSALVVRAERHGTLLVPASSFSIDGTGLESWLRLPFALSESSLRRAVATIATASGELDGAPARPPRRTVLA